MNAWEQAPLAQGGAWQNAPLVEDQNDELLTKYGLKPETVARMGGPAQVLKMIGEQEINPADDVGRAEAAAISYGRGTLDFYQGLKQMYLQKFGGEGAAEKYTRDVMRELDQYDKLQSRYPVTSTVGRIGGAIGSVPVPSPAGIAGKGAVAAAKSAGKGALASGALAGSMFAREGESRLANAVIGAGVGAAAGPVMRGASAAVNKGINAARDRINPVAKTLLEEAEKRGIRLSMSDVIGDRAFLGKAARDAEILSENVPFGMYNFRQKQHDDFKSAMTRLLSDSRRYLGTDDPGEAVQKGLISQLNRYRERANKLFERVASLSDEAADRLPEKIGDARVFIKTENMNRVASEFAEKHKTVGRPELRSGISDFVETLSHNPRVRSFRGLQEVRDKIKARIEQHYAGQAEISKKGIHELIAIKNALEQDMEGYARNAGGNIWKAFKRANEYYKTTIARYKNDRLLSQVAGAEVDTVTPLWLKQGRADRVRRLYEFGTPEVQRAMRATIVEDIAERAATPGRDTLSPAKFTGWFDRYRKAVNVAFKGDSEFRAQLEGMNRVARAIKRAGEVVENPPTGNRLVQAATAGSLTAGVATGNLGMLARGATKVAAFTGALKAFSTTPWVQRYFLAASRHHPKSKAMQRLLKELETRMAAAPGALVGQQ